MNVVHRIIAIGNLTAFQCGNLIRTTQEAMGKQLVEILRQVIHEKYYLLKYDLMVLEYIDKENIHMFDSQNRIRIINNIKKVKFSEWNLRNTLQIATVVCEREYSYHKFTYCILIQMEIPYSNMRTAIMICSKEGVNFFYINIAIKSIIYSETSLLEKYTTFKLMLLLRKEKIREVCKGLYNFEEEWNEYEDCAISYGFSTRSSELDFDVKDLARVIFSTRATQVFIDSKKRKSVEDQPCYYGIHKNGERYAIKENMHRSYSQEEYFFMIAVLTEDEEIIDEYIKSDVSKHLYINAIVFLANKGIAKYANSFIANNNVTYRHKFYLFQYIVDYNLKSRYISSFNNHLGDMSEEDREIFRKIQNI